MTTEIMPVPDAFDFRVNVDNETQDAIRAQITEAVAAKQAKAVKDCWSRARDVLERISKQCSDKKGRIHDSLMESAADLVAVLKGLNITNDPQIAQMERDIAQLIVPTTAIRVSKPRDNVLLMARPAFLPIYLHEVTYGWAVTTINLPRVSSFQEAEKVWSGAEDCSERGGWRPDKRPLESSACRTKPSSKAQVPTVRRTPCACTTRR